MFRKSYIFLWLLCLMFFGTALIAPDRAASNTPAVDTPRNQALLTSVLDCGLRWIKSKSRKVFAGCLFSVFLIEVWGAKGRSWIDKLGAIFLRNAFKSLSDTMLLTDGMSKRYELLLWLWSETTSPELKMLIKENLALLDELCCKYKDKQKQQVYLASIKLRLLRLSRDTNWARDIKALLFNQLQKLAKGKSLLEERSLCLMTKGYGACCKTIIDKLSLVLGREPLVIDCNLLHEHDVRPPTIGDKLVHQPTIFTRLYLRRKPGINFIVVKNIETLEVGPKLRAMQKFLGDRKSPFDPSVGDCLDFSQDFIIATTNDRAFVETHLENHLRLFAFEKGSEIVSFIRFLRLEFLQERLRISERYLYPDECEKLLDFYNNYYSNKSFDKFCVSFFSLLNTYDGNVLAVFSELLRRREAKLDMNNIESFSVKKLLKIKLQGLISDEYALKIAIRDQQELAILYAANHPGVAEVATHLRKVLQISRLNTTLTIVTPELTLRAVKNKLDISHFGLEKLKSKILSYVAMLIANVDGMKGKVLLLVGPPGTGKTTIAQTLAIAMHKPFAKVSCGGIIQQGQLKGWPRSYQQAQEGLLIQALLRSKSLSSVLLLDEVDKLILGGKEELYAPLLEILDPEQNKRVLDHYLENFFDYSAVFFVLTANDIKGLPRAFLDRCHVIYLPAYTMDEKLKIAQDFLLPKVLGDLRPEIARSLYFPPSLLKKLVVLDSHQAGVRKLQERIEAIIGTALQDFLLTGSWNAVFTQPTP